MAHEEYGDSKENSQMPGFKGNMYQSKLLMLYLYRALSLNYEFELGTEIEEAHKYDDLVFKYKKFSEGNERDHFSILQSKHRVNKNAKITHQDILTDDNVDFGLVKYYNAYKKAKNEKLFENGTIEHAIVYTNAKLDLFKAIPEKNSKWKSLKNLKNIIQEIKVEDNSVLSLCKIKNEGKYYQFKSDLVLPVLKPMLSIYYNIVQRLVKLLIDKKCLSHDDVIFKHCHQLLAKEVIDMNEKVFRKDFIEEKCDAVENPTGRQKLRIALNEVLDDEKLELDEIIKNKFLFTKGFGNITNNKPEKQTWLLANIKLFKEELEDKSKISDYNLKELAKQLIEHLVEKKNINKKEPVFEAYHLLLARDVIDVKNKKFLDTFINYDMKCEESDKSFKGLGKFRKIFLEEMKTQNLRLDEINEYMESKKISIMLCRGIGEQENEISQIWPEKDETDEDIKEYLKMFVLAIGQPNEKELGDVILSELDELYVSHDSEFIYSYFLSEIQEWMSGEGFTIKKSENISKSRFISSQCAKEFFRKTQRKFNKKVLKGPSIKYNKYIQDFNINFVDYEMENCIKNYLSSEKKILYIISEHISTSSIKVYIELKKNMTNQEEFIYVRLSSLLNSSLNSVIEAFKSEMIDHLIVIECDLEKTKYDELIEKIDEAFSQIIEIVEGNDKKKLILITKEENMNNLSEIFSLDIEFDENYDTKNGLVNLTKDSQNYFLNKEIKFQGINIELRHLINEESKKLITGEIIYKMLKNQAIEIGKQVEGLKNIQKHYINRKFIFLAENKDKMYLLSGINENSFYYDWDDSISSINNLETKSLTEEEIHTFQRLSNENASKNIFLLRKENDQFELLKKSGTSLFEEQDFKKMINDNSKYVINLISAIAGMGKSTMFTQLSHKFKENNHNMWVIKIELNAASTKLNEILENNKDIDMEVILDFIYNSAKLESELEKKLFEFHLHQKRIVLVIDGFDEVCPRYKDLVIKIIRNIERKASIRRIWISTRPYDSIIDDMKKSFDMKHYEIEPFTLDDQKEYLKNFWQDSLKTDINENCFKVFIENLFEILSSNIKDNRMELLGVALHTEMIGFTFRSIFEKFHEDNSLEISEGHREELIEMLQLSQLYKKFIKFKMEIYFEKSNLNLKQEAGNNNAKILYDDFVKKSKILALDTLFINNQLDLFLTPIEKDELKEYKNKVKEDGDLIGIVNQINNEKPNFIHRTFAEYFVSVYFIDIFKKGDDRAKSILDCFLRNFVNDQYIGVCNFIDSEFNSEITQKLTENNYKNVIEKLDEKLIHVVLKNKWQRLAEFLIENGVNLNYIDKKGRSVLHLVSVLQNYGNVKEEQNIIKMVLEKIENTQKKLELILQKDENNDTPLSIAMENDKFDNAKAIINVSDDNGILIDLLKIENRYSNNIFHFAANNHHHEELTFLSSYLKKYSDVLKELLQKKNKVGDTPISIAEKNGILEHVKTLVNASDELQILDGVLLNENMDGCNILHLSATRKDDKIFNFLLSYFESHSETIKLLLQKRNKKNDTPLFVAVEYAELCNVKFIINICKKIQIIDEELKTKNHNGYNILHKAAVNHDSQVLIFLMDYLNYDPKLLRLLLLDKNNEGDTPLSIAVKNGGLQNVKATINKCDEFQILHGILKNENRHGNNILHRVAKNNDNELSIFILNQFENRLQSDILKTLLLKKNQSGDIPFIVAAKNGGSDFVKALVQVCQNLRILDEVLKSENKKGFNVLHKAATNCDGNVLMLLLDHLKDNSQILKVMLQKMNKAGNTPLVVAEKDEKYENVRVLKNIYDGLLM